MRNKGKGFIRRFGVIDPEGEGRLPYEFREELPDIFGSALINAANEIYEVEPIIGEYANELRPGDKFLGGVYLDPFFASGVINTYYPIRSAVASADLATRFGI